VRGQLGQRPVAGRVEREGELDERTALGVDLDRPNLTTLGDLSGRPVADRRSERGAAGLMLLVEPLLDFRREVVGVVLRERGEHSVHQAPGRRLVDVLAGRDQADAHLLELVIEQRVVEPVASQAIDLVDDQVVGAELRQLLEHLLQHRAVIAPCRLRPLYVGFDYLGADTFGGGCASLDLRRNRVAVRVAVAAELANAGDAGVDRSALARDPGPGLSFVLLLRHLDVLLSISCGLSVSLLRGLDQRVK
jgi:hypothetical protein